MFGLSFTIRNTSVVEDAIKSRNDKLLFSNFKDTVIIDGKKGVTPWELSLGNLNISLAEFCEHNCKADGIWFTLATYLGCLQGVNRWLIDTWKLR